MREPELSGPPEDIGVKTGHHCCLEEPAAQKFEALNSSKPKAQYSIEPKQT